LKEVSLKIVFWTEAVILLHFLAASLTSFCQISQGGCAYQYFVGTSGVTFTSEGTVVEVMSIGKNFDVLYCII